MIGWARDILLDERSAQRGWTRRQEVAALLRQHEHGSRDHAKRIWALVCLELWARHHLDGHARMGQSQCRVAMLLRCLGMMRGGGETRHLAWIRELTALGVDVEVITGRPLFRAMRFPVTDVESRDTTVIRSPYLRDLVYKMQNRRGFGRLGVVMLHADEEWFCKMAWQHLAASRRKPDIVHAHALHQTARLKTIDVPVAVNLPGEPNPRYVGDLQRADVLLSDGWGARKLPAILGRPVEHITKGVDAALFTPEGPSIRSSLGVGSSPVALVVSRLVPIKNVALFVDAMPLRTATIPMRVP